MANTKSALKRIKVSEKKHQRNQAVKSSTRTFVKKARTVITQEPTAAQDDLKAAISALDIAARKGVIHRNNAARRKSRLMKLFNTELAAAAATADAPTTEEKPKRARRSTSSTSKTATASKTTRTTRKKKDES